MHNRALMTALAEALRPLPVYSVARLDYDPDTLEAVSFALLGYLCVARTPVDLRHATQARRPAILGRLSFP